ncbi:MAG TPA: RES family NAD+ phosphorylase [Nocardioidaceae bacterium]|nr:RES family NAD+ phosphorylase [Actinomycetota bacterium]HEV8055113.1 RES family NAD+ phosphorylase [Nocardioidaceae bacterium]
MAKLPLPPSPSQLRRIGVELRPESAHTVFWRVHHTMGSHVVPWNALRRYGPVARCRFDPHEPPARDQAVGVCYLAADVPTALAEFCQLTRTVNVRRKAPHLTGLSVARPLQLLDLTGRWPLRAGASQAINTGRRDVTRAWARAITSAWPDLDGLRHASSMTGRPCVTLFDPAADALPSEPSFSEPLAHPGLRPWLAAACRDIGYQLL